MEPIKVTHYQLNEIEQLIEMAQKRVGNMSKFSVENHILEKYQVSSLSDLKASDGDAILEDVQQLMFNKHLSR